MSESNNITTEGARILIVDDVPANLRILSEALESQGYRIQAATDGATALKIVEATPPELILMDVMMPDMDGYETCQRIHQMPGLENLPILFITALNDTEDIVAGFKAGGIDYLTKPFAEEEVHARVKTHLRIARLTQALQERNAKLEKAIQDRIAAEMLTKEMKRRVEILVEQDEDRWGYAGIIGQSPQFENILNQVQLLQRADRTSALVTGESGVGKEMIARSIHHGGSRSNGPFIAMNCSAIPKELTESTLFGHLKGSFTGATSDKPGLFAQAHQGTLFLDEIGEMPLELQAKLLRVLESGTFTPLGSTREQSSDVRIMAATNIDFSRRIQDGTFREDLYYRLARFVIEIPPLRDRKDDIPLLAAHFAEHFSAEMGYRQCVPITREAFTQLQEHSFPGNVRELKNIMERAVLESGGNAILPHNLHFLSGIQPKNNQVTTAAFNDINHNNNNKQSTLQDTEKLINKRSQTSGEENLETDESRIIQYLKEHGMINNSDCRELLKVDRHRANYLLKKLNQYGLLRIEGSGRWVVYKLDRK